MNKRRRIFLAYITQDGEMLRSVGSVTTFNKALQNISNELWRIDESYREVCHGLSYVIKNIETGELLK